MIAMLEWALAKQEARFERKVKEKANTLAQEFAKPLAQKMAQEIALEIAQEMVVEMAIGMSRTEINQFRQDFTQRTQAWLEGRAAANAAGLPFDEPFPSAEDPNPST